MSAASGPPEQDLPPWAAPGQPLGDPDRFGVHITSVHLAGDQPPLTLTSPGVTAIVGPNNSGKTTLLRQLHTQLTYPGAPVQLVTEVALDRQGSGADLLAWLGRHATYQAMSSANPAEGPVFVRTGGGRVPVAQCPAWWTNYAPTSLYGLGPALVFYADAQSRLMQVGGARNVTTSPTHQRTRCTTCKTTWTCSPGSTASATTFCASR